MQHQSESALIIEVPAAEPLVGSWRHDHDPVASRGIPAHITVLFPFLPPRALTDADVTRLAQVYEHQRPFEVTLARVDSFPGVVWLAPEPDELLRKLTAVTEAEFPSCVPYGGRHSGHVPHLTVAQSSDSYIFGGLLYQISRSLRDELPITTEVTNVSLWVSRSATAWERLARLPLG